MADETTITVAHQYEDENDVSLQNFGVADLKLDCATLTPLHRVQTVTTTEAALNLGGLTAAGAILIGKNLDETNYMELRSGTGAGNDIVKYGPGECWPYRLGSDITAPFVISNTASVKFEYRLIPA